MKEKTGAVVIDGHSVDGPNTTYDQRSVARDYFDHFGAFVGSVRLDIFNAPDRSAGPDDPPEGAPPLPFGMERSSSSRARESPPSGSLPVRRKSSTAEDNAALS